MNIAGIFLPYSDRTWKFSRKLIIAAIFLATFVIVQNMVISTIFNGVCLGYPPPFHHPCIANLGNLTHCVCSRSMKQRFVMIEFQISFQFVKRKASNYWESEQLKKTLQIAEHSRTFFFIYPRKVFFCISTKPENRWRVVLRFCRQYFLLSITPSSISQCLYFVFWIPEKSEKKRRGKNINSWRPSLPGGCRPVPSGATITPAGRENTLYPTCQTCWYQ